MNAVGFILRSLRYYRRAHLWVVAGCAMCTAILVGALIVGDSVRYSLRRMVEVRLGRTQFAMASGDRFFRAALAEELAGRIGTIVAPILQVRGMGVAGGGEKRANRISIVGVDGRFGEIGEVRGIYGELAQDEVVVNRALASQLGLAVGDRLLLRFEALEAMPPDAPLASPEAQTTARSYAVKGIVGSSEFGGFRLQNSQIASGAAFLSLPELARGLELEGRANGLLVAEKPEAPLAIEEVKAALGESWRLADAGLEWRAVRDGRSGELRSRRIFLEPAVLEAAARTGERFQPILTYFVNEIRKEDRYTPYSFVSAPGAPIVSAEMRDDEIILNEWLADDTGAGVGDRVQLRYYVLERMGRLREVTADFQVRAIVPLKGIYADRELLPDFPGMSDEAHCRDWETGVPVDYGRIRPKDEDYWTEFRGTPKAFVTLEAARLMWQNRFGNATAIRFEGNREEIVERKLIEKLKPARFGLIFRDVREEGDRASAQAVDFSQLFLGLSFFVIAASLLLTGLLFAFHVETRSQETGLLLAVGFSSGSVRRMALAEGAVLACAGSVLGGVAGIGINQLILRALATVWIGAVGAASLQMHLEPATILMGIGIGALLAVGVVWLVIRRQTREPITDLQRERAPIASMPHGLPRISAGMALVCLLAVAVLLGYSVGEERGVMAIYFAAGTLLLVGGMGLVDLLIYLPRRILRAPGLSLLRIGIHNLGRRRLRSLTLTGLLACGLFLVFTVGANRKNANVDADRRESGTGGFALYGESAVPVLDDLNRAEVREEYGLDLPQLGGVRFVQFRVREGDDASCLNLTRVAHPRLLGVDPDELARRGAFTFARAIPGVNRDDPWRILERPPDGGAIPAVADLTVIQWGLGKSVGDTLVYTDERGSSFTVELVGGLANSVFQGNLIVAEERLIEKYPSSSAYRLFLIDAPAAAVDQVAGKISWALQDWGIELMRSSERLAAFNQVENTYLSIFLILGGFGLILGSVGIGIVVLRGVHERRGEMALLRAVGYSGGMLRQMIRLEYMLLLLAGTVLGVVSAFVATYPTLTADGAEIPYLTILALLVLVFANGGLWIHLAAAMALRGRLLAALRKE